MYRNIRQIIGQNNVQIYETEILDRNITDL